MTNETEFISIMEAGKRCDTGEWITDLKVLEKVEDQANAIREQLTNWPDTPRDRKDWEMVQHIFQATPDCLSSQLEHAFISQPQQNLYVMEVRVTANVVYKIKPTILDAAVHFLSLMVALSAVSPFSYLFKVWFTLSSLQLFRTIWKGWERIRDPKEKIVFEAIYKLQNKLCAKNYNALDQGNFASAFGYVSPSIQELAFVLKQQLTKKEIESALASLERRDIIASKKGRYSISF